MVEIFTEADVYGTNDNDNVVDDGYWNDDGFSSNTGEQCSCKTREEHIAHIRRILPYEKHMEYKENADLE